MPDTPNPDVMRHMIETLEKTARDEMNRITDANTARIESLKDSFHVLTEKVAKLDGVMQERTTNLKEADMDAKQDIGSLRDSIDSFRREMAKDMKIISNQVTEGRVKVGIIMGVSAAAFGGLASFLVQKATS